MGMVTVFRPTPGPAPRQPFSMPLRILHVEDTRAIQRLISRVLSDVADVVSVDDVAAAVALFEKEKFDLVLADFLFPAGDAMPLIFRVREQFTPLQLPIVMLTSAADRATLSKFHQAGVNVTVKKPPETARLRETLLQMAREPWVEVPEFACSDFQLLLWRTAHHAFVFCPNLGLQTEADTPDEAMRRMREQIDSVVDLSVPAITTPKLVSYNPQSRLNKPLTAAPLEAASEPAAPSA